MKPLPHLYEVSLKDGPGGYATLSAGGPPELRMAPPVEFDGPGDAWSPEQLLVAAVESCFLFTLRAVAAASKLEYTSVHITGEGLLERKDGVTRITEVVLRPVLSLPPGSDSSAATRVLEKSARFCFLSASLSAPVRLEPRILASDAT
ncbi:MAG TPA: OsmC family protein [Candidatus Binataceae bacterium]|nr:OsmC family protein [Candidatus Binataceae bacterium]